MRKTCEKILATYIKGEVGETVESSSPGRSLMGLSFSIGYLDAAISREEFMDYR